MPESVAVPTLGTTIAINGTPVGQIQDITGPQLSTDTDEITNHSSPDNTEEFIATIKRTGTIDFPLVFNPDDAAHSAMFTAWKNRTRDLYDLTYPDETGTAGQGANWQFDAYVVGFSMAAPVDGHLSADVSLRVAAAPSYSHS